MKVVKQKVEIIMLVSLMGWVYKMILNFILIMIYYVENYIY